MRLAMNAVYSIISAAVPAFVSIVTVPIYLKLIGSERYGALMIGWLLLGYFGQADFGIARAITQRISALGQDARKERVAAVWSAVCGVILFSLVSGALVYAASSYFFAGPLKVEAGLRAEMMASRWYLALCIPVIAISSTFAGALMGLERFKLVSFGNLTSSIAMQVLPLGVAFFIGGNLTDLIAAALAGRIIGLVIVGAGAWITFLRDEPFSATWSEFRHLFTFGIWIMLTMIVGPMMTMADRFVIGATIGTAAVAIYAVPFQIASRTVMFPLAISQVLFPRFAADSVERSLDRCRDSTVLIGQIYAPMVIGLACLAAPLLDVWIGNALDRQSIIIGQIVLAGFWTNAIASVPYAYIQARGNPRYTALLHVIELPLYTAALYLLHMKFGLIGIAAAFSLRCAVDCLLLMLSARIWSKDLLIRLGVPGLLVLSSIFAGQAFQTWVSSLATGVSIASVAAVFALVQMPLAVRSQLQALPIIRSIPVLRARSL
ncbi:flippase [Novosphingobium sp. CECT 9465]|uniref:flippase n=1 Tax=Novosphingobium sp. CECT 9465 TaxID=2829794 RepID=UPI001E32BA3F|nr:flippase [Novosphingobium sp. CECT 9465]CAH0497934.1 hypothetical protein NVSP9465_03006 [Novosphingobium sp. CECT 9465]